MKLLDVRFLQYKIQDKLIGIIINVKTFVLYKKSTQIKLFLLSALSYRLLNLIKPKNLSSKSDL
ncbi:hypothetical protein A6769_08775 [Nostoc punctiforme NIES-2108]|uniref:Uncharacterized protein n=1 Tax=Nostoc punctiforme NIES-2108 TaxID=1356359 RepID=A0A367RRZ5_NOSPU|nr:hypothetical protein A6769_08775 [Nostoc punctiforme NIES-2108]